MRKIAITSGHVGKGTGAVKLIDEGAETINLKNAIYKRFNAISYVDPTNLSLTEVINQINAILGSDDIAIDIHFNSGGGTGTECCVADACAQGGTTYKLAKDLTSRVSRALGIRNRGVKYEKQTQHKELGYCRRLKCHSMLLEVCFCDNQGDVEAYWARKEAVIDAIIATLNDWRE